MEHMSAATQEAYPSLAEIVRQETDGGRRIVEFYLGVADGSLEGFEDRHRMSAARRLDKIAPGLVAEYLQKYANSQCRPSLRGSRLPLVRRSPIKRDPPEGTEQAPRGPNVFQRRLEQLVREETGNGKAIVHFMVGVMNGAITGYKPHHRLEAARELASYITPNDSTHSSRRSREDGNPSPALPPKGWIPADAGMTERGSIRILDNSTVVPEQSGAGTHPAPVRSEPKIARPEPADSPVVPVQTGTHPVPVRTRPSEGTQLETKNQKPRTRRPRRLRRQEGDARARMRRNAARNRPYFEQKDLERKKNAEKPKLVGEPIPNLWERRIKEKLEQHWHEPDPLAGSGPIFSTTPSRSPP